MLRRLDDEISQAGAPAPPGETRARARRRSRFAFLCFVVVSVVVPLLLYGFAAYRDWQNVEQEGRDRVRHMRDALSEHVLRAFRTQQSVALAIDSRFRGRSWDEIAATPELRAVPRRGRGGVPGGAWHLARRRGRDPARREPRAAGAGRRISRTATGSGRRGAATPGRWSCRVPATSPARPSGSPSGAMPRTAASTARSGPRFRRSISAPFTTSSQTPAARSRSCTETALSCGATPMPPLFRPRSARTRPSSPASPSATRTCTSRARPSTGSAGSTAMSASATSRSMSATASPRRSWCGSGTGGCRRRPCTSSRRRSRSSSSPSTLGARTTISRARSASAPRRCRARSPSASSS